MIVDIELLEKRLALLERDGFGLVSLSIVRVRELLDRLKRAEFATAPTRVYERVTDEQVEACRGRGWDATGSEVP